LSEDLHALQPEEAAVLAMLQQRLKHEQENPSPPARSQRKAA